MAATNFIPGPYKVISPVYVRKEARIVNGNRVGTHGMGDRVEVYEVLTDNKNQTWGRVSEYDSAGKAQWMCLKEINRQYAELIETPFQSQALARLWNLEVWARSQGYTG